MNKSDLIEALKNEVIGLTQAEANKVVELFSDEMENALSNSYRIELRGLCSFYVKEYGRYIGRNPRTGEKVEMAPKKLPFFKCGKELKERVDS